MKVLKVGFLRCGFWVRQVSWVPANDPCLQLAGAGMRGYPLRPPNGVAGKLRGDFGGPRQHAKIFALEETEGERVR